MHDLQFQGIPACGENMKTVQKTAKKEHEDREMKFLKSLLDDNSFVRHRKWDEYQVGFLGRNASGGRIVRRTRHSLKVARTREHQERQRHMHAKSSTAHGIEPPNFALSKHQTPSPQSCSEKKKKT